MDSKPTRNTGRWILGIIVLLALTWLGWWQWGTLTGRGESGAEQVPAAAAVEPTRNPSDEGEDPSDLDPIPAEAQWVEAFGEEPVWPADLAEPLSCEDVESDLARLCSVLDQRDTVRNAAPPGGSCGMLRTVAGALAVRPPDITSELKNYPIMLDNVFHLFRVLGRERLDLLRRVQIEEQALAEPAAMAIYRWLATRERCSRSGRTTLTTEALYEYAGFFIDTMGGQAYLRRRTPRMEALASFYCLLLIERAREGGYDPAGLDLRFQIRRTRDLMSAQPFVFRDRYVAILDRLAEDWKRRSNPL